MQLTDQIDNTFEKNNFTLGVFIDLFKAFDTVDHYILLTNLKRIKNKGKQFTFVRELPRNSKTMHYIQL